MFYTNTLSKAVSKSVRTLSIWDVAKSEEGLIILCLDMAKLIIVNVHYDDHVECYIKNY